MKVTTIGNPEIIMQNPDSIHNYFAWSTVARLQNGKLAAVASGFRREHVCPFGKTVISYSEDEGKSWTLPAPVIDTHLDDRDGGILAFGEKGVIVTSFNNSLKFQKSVADTYKIRTWQGDYFKAYLGMVKSEEEDKYIGSTFRVSNDCGVTFGPIYKTPVSSPHGPCELPDGTILYVGTLFEYAKTDCENLVEAYAITADGKSEYRGRIEPIVINGQRIFSYEPHAFALKDGTVICHIRAEHGGTDFDSKVFTIFQSVSADGGRTWTKPEQIIDICGGAPAHIMQHSSGALISSYGYRHDSPYGIKAMISFDNGKTWNADYDIYTNEISVDIGYPSTVELSDGSLLTVFYAHAEKDGPAVIMQQRWKLES